jgi:hypothetical protein
MAASTHFAVISDEEKTPGSRQQEKTLESQRPGIPDAIWK